MYSLGNSAPIDNRPPMQNQYSNPEVNNPYRQVNNQQFNNQISDSVNSNNSYEIYQTQEYPSNTLFNEQNAQTTDYGYTNCNNGYSGALIQSNQPIRKTISHPSELYSIENFENEENNYNELERNSNKLDKMKMHKESPIIQHGQQQGQYQGQQQGQQYQYGQQHQGQYQQGQQQGQQGQPVIYNNYNQTPKYLNSDSIPNIAGLYNTLNSPRPVEKIIIKEYDNRETKITDLDNDDNDDDDDNSSKKSVKKNLKKKIDNKIDNKINKKIKKKNNIKFIIIFLLIIIIGLILYIIMNSKVKRVRF